MLMYPNDAQLEHLVVHILRLLRQTWACHYRRLTPAQVRDKLVWRLLHVVQQTCRARLWHELLNCVSRGSVQYAYCMGLIKYSLSSEDYH